MNIDEKDLSTKQYQSKAHPRVSRSDEDSRGSCGYQEAADERTQTPQCTDTAQAGAPLAARTVRHTFPKAARLLVRREFLAIQRRGERRYSRNFIVITSPARTARPRLGVTASRRYGNAVIRNQMKRRLREFFRVRQARMSPTHDILIIPKSRAKELSFAQIVTELEKVLPIAQRTQ
jgi:ribonuclease P protein component